MVELEVYRKRLERIEELLEELSERSEKGAIIIVEGKRDILALKKLGIKGKFELATRAPLLNLSERIASQGREVIVLTDWDRRGELLVSKFSTYFGSLGLKPDFDIRRKLKLITQKEIKDVESLYTYVSKLRDLTGSRKLYDPEY
ncbi:MAG: toprim domain-containing protein [Methanosarcinaceae archaeon]|nr:toprim domain-containing protein [Methanosarcinaceae archaeon]MDD4332156.1 toprim domain-containing protein [Methanosarcinaceae archaeon]MDD4748456.1 toprim domain-containing protein [Methanosarcinaceae archaeon]